MDLRREITKKYAADYAKSSKNAKGLVLEELVADTGSSRANDRRALFTARKRKALRGWRYGSLGDEPMGMTRLKS